MNISTQLRYCLNCLLRELDFFKEQIKELEKKLKELFKQKQYAAKIKILQTHPGIGPVIARQFATEIFNPRRFKSNSPPTKQLSKLLRE